MLVNFGSFQSGHTRQKYAKFLTTRWAKQHPKTVHKHSRTRGNSFKTSLRSLIRTALLHDPLGVYPMKISENFWEVSFNFFGGDYSLETVHYVAPPSLCGRCSSKATCSRACPFSDSTSITAWRSPLSCSVPNRRASPFWDTALITISRSPCFSVHSHLRAWTVKPSGASRDAPHGVATL